MSLILRLKYLQYSCSSRWPYLMWNQDTLARCLANLVLLLFSKERYEEEILSQAKVIFLILDLYSVAHYFTSPVEIIALFRNPSSAAKNQITKSPFTAFLREYANFFINPKRYNLPPISVTTLIRWDLRKVSRAYHGHISPIQAYFSSGWLPQRKQTLLFLA